MNWEKLGESVAAKMGGNPQRMMRAELALKGIHDLVNDLAALGVVIEVSEGSSAPPLEWPKMVYARGSHGETREQIVNSPAQRASLGPEWVDSPGELQAPPAAANPEAAP